MRRRCDDPFPLATGLCAPFPGVPMSGALSDPIFAVLLDSPPPPVDTAAAEALLRDLWGIEGRAESLACERDANFRITTEAGPGYVLKVANPAEARATTAFQVEALRWLERTAPTLPVPRMVATRGGDFLTPLALVDGRDSTVRLLSWVPGTPVARTGGAGALAAQIGTLAAQLGTGLAGVRHPAAGHEILWDIRHLPRLTPLLASLPAGALRDQLQAEIDHFAAAVAPRLPALRWQVVHNDLNHHNLVIDPQAPERIAGVLDFGDMVRTARAIDVAVAASYLTHLEDDPLAPVVRMVAAYAAVTPLDAAEIELLRDLIVARLVASIAITEWRAARYPENAEYILRNNRGARAGMAGFAALPRETVTAALRAAAEEGVR